jgi:hypothetical protein
MTSLANKFRLKQYFKKTIFFFPLLFFLSMKSSLYPPGSGCGCDPDRDLVFKSAPGVPAYWTEVTYGNGLYVAVAGFGAERVMTSPDGINWTSHSSPENNGWNTITYGNERFVALSGAETNQVMYSDW